MAINIFNIGNHIGLKCAINWNINCTRILIYFERLPKTQKRNILYVKEMFL